MSDAGLIEIVDMASWPTRLLIGWYISNTPVNASVQNSAIQA
jgi:hypothetical protein